MKTLRWIVRLGCAAAFLLPAPRISAQEGPVEGTAAQAPPPASARKFSDRLRALEAENRRLLEAAARLEAGEAVDPAMVIEDRLPPLVLASDGEDAGPMARLTEAAAGIMEEMLGCKQTETEKLLEIQSRIEQGRAVALDEVEHPEALGLAARQRVLEASEAALAELRARLQALEEEARFRRAARVESREGEKDPGEGVASREDAAGPVVQPGGAATPAGAATAGALEEEAGPEPTAAAEASSPESAGLVADRTALALSCYRTGRFEEALQAFRAVDPASRTEGPFVLYMIGRTLERLGRLDEAEKAYTEVASQFPESPWVKESEFARKVLAWKKEMGPIEGVPTEAARFLRPPEERDEAPPSAGAAKGGEGG